MDLVYDVVAISLEQKQTRDNRGFVRAPEGDNHRRIENEEF
jgi:hypothetical protein